jgi:Ca-activated chloride channel family protein
MSTITAFSGTKKTFRNYLRHFLFGLRMLALGILIVALARPQSTDRWEDVTTEGIDIVVALDISPSMLARDFNPNRLEAAKDVAVQFIAGRDNDRMGLVVFSGESFTQCPLTTDHAVLMNLFKDVETGMIEDGTAIGMGLANAVNRLKDSEAESKVIILLTDGENNMGAIDPITAAELAQTFGIRVYTIGVGTRGKAEFPVGYDRFGRLVFDYMEVNIDEETLTQIASIADGEYFRATNKNALVEVYEEIDKLEKSKIDVKQHKRVNDEYLWFVVMGIGIFVIELFLRYIFLKTIP